MTKQDTAHPSLPWTEDDNPQGAWPIVMDHDGQDVGQFFRKIAVTGGTTLT